MNYKIPNIRNKLNFAKNKKKNEKKHVLLEGMFESKI